MTETVLLWIFGSVFTIILSLISLVFWQHTKSDEDISKKLELHLLAFTESLKQDAIMYSEVRHLSSDLPKMHADTRDFVSRELIHLKEVGDAERLAASELVKSMNIEIIRLREKIVMQSEELRLNTTTIASLNAEVAKLRDKVNEQSEQIIALKEGRLVSRNPSEKN